MGLRDDLAADIDGVLSQAWDTRDGTAVPTTDTVALAGGGVNLKATMLYADLADSTSLAMWDRQVTARICKAFLAASSRIIRARDGEIRSFDGDRVMGVFLGNYKNANAVKCALQLPGCFKSSFDRNSRPNTRSCGMAPFTFPIARASTTAMCSWSAREFVTTTI
jgi:class 3 adenylate cyclase